MTSTAPLGYHDLLEAKLISAVTTTTSTGVTVKVKQVNGATPTWPTIAHRLKVIQRTATKTKAEIWDIAAGTTQSGQTVTLGTITRGLSLADGTSFAAGTGISFAAGADVFMTWDVKDAAGTAKLDLNNVFTGTNTFNGAVTTTNFKVPVYADATARDAAITVPANGMIVYLTDAGAMYQYIGGAWATFASGTTANASDTVAGKVERATTAQANAGTDTGETGAPTFVRPSEVTTVANLASTANGLGSALVGHEGGTTVKAALDGHDTSIAAIHKTTLTAGGTINGATLPVPVYMKEADGELYAADANDTAAMQFIGFAVSNSTDGQPIQLQGHGVVSGFTGLTVGAEYYVQDTVGTIGTTASTTRVIPVGIAVSATQILIQRKPMFADGVITDFYDNTIGDNDETVTIGFQPRKIILHYYIQGYASGSFQLESGIAVYHGTTLKLRHIIGTGTAGDNADPASTDNTPNSTAAVTIGAVAANADIRMTISIPSVSDTGFVIRRKTEDDSNPGTNLARAKIAYEAFE